VELHHRHRAFVAVHHHGSGGAGDHEVELLPLCTVRHYLYPGGLKDRNLDGDFTVRSNKLDI
jgi:hypothetical protein